MADTLELEVKERGLSSVLSKVNSLRKGLGFTREEVGGLAARFVGLQAAVRLAEAGIRAINSYIHDSVNLFREFELRVAEVNTILDEQSESILPKLEQGIAHLAIRYGQATSDMAKGLYDILSSAFEAKDALVLLNTAAKASVAGLTDVRTSVQIFTSIMNTYGMSVNEAAHLSDQLFQSVIRGRYQFGDLEASIGYVVPIAKQAGLTFKETASALMTTTRHGLHLDMTSRGLALAIQNIQSPTAKAQKAADMYGISMDDVSLKAKGLVGWMKELNAATKEYGRTVVQELFPNMRAQRVMSVLVSDEGIKGMVEDYDLLIESLGRTDEAFKKIESTEAFQTRIMEEYGKVADRITGEILSEPVRRTTSFWGAIWDYVVGWFTTGGTPYWQVAAPAAQAIYDTMGKLVDTGRESAYIESAQTDIKQWRNNYNDMQKAFAELTDVLIPQAEHQVALTKATWAYNYAQHDVKVGMLGLTELYRGNNKMLHDAINAVYEYTKAQKENEEQIERTNLAMRENNIMIMKIQLKGMARRRGLTRSEERMMKQLRIENLQMRIEYEENAQAMNVSDYDRYLSAKEIVDKQIALAYTRVFDLNDTYQVDLKNYTDYLNKLKGKYAEWIEAMNSLSARIRFNEFRVAQVSGGASIEDTERIIRNITPIIPNFERELDRTGYGRFMKNKFGFQRGTYHVPETGIYPLTRGEQVVPKGGRGGNNITVNIPVTIGNVSSDVDINKIAAAIGRAAKAKLITLNNSRYSTR